MLSSIHGLISKLLLDSKNLIVLSESIGSAWSSTLDLSSSKTADEISNEVVFCLSTSVGHNDSPSGSLRHVGCLNTLGDGTNLVHFEQKGIAKLLVDTGLHSCWVSDQEIVSHNLDLVAHELGHFDVSLEIILIEWIFDGNKWVLISKVLVEFNSLILGKDSIVLSGLLTEVIGLVLWIEELGGSNIKTNINFTSMS